MWKHRGTQRPAFADKPGPGQESVWDYPRPPAIVSTVKRIEVRFGDVLLAGTERGLRILETASPPSVYLPQADVHLDLLQRAPGASFCEWKGEASYWALVAAPELGPIAWSYATPSSGFAAIANHISFYPARVACFLGGERVKPQPGGFYGGWLTADIAGPVKGEPGTGGW